MASRCFTDPLDPAIDVCDICSGNFCAAHLVDSKAHKHPICIECALATSGVRPAAAIQKVENPRTARTRRAELKEGAAQAPPVFVYFDEAAVKRVRAAAPPAESDSASPTVPSPPKPPQPPRHDQGGSYADLVDELYEPAIANMIPPFEAAASPHPPANFEAAASPHPPANFEAAASPHPPANFEAAAPVKSQTASEPDRTGETWGLDRMVGGSESAFGQQQTPPPPTRASPTFIENPEPSDRLPPVITNKSHMLDQIVEDKQSRAEELANKLAARLQEK